MQAQVVVWNSDARYKAELEVEIELVESSLEVPGEHVSRRDVTLEVELELERDDELLDGWFLSEDEIVALDDYTVYDAKPVGYSTAYKLAI